MIKCGLLKHTHTDTWAQMFGADASEQAQEHTWSETKAECTRTCQTNAGVTSHTTVSRPALQ